MNDPSICHVNLAGGFRGGERQTFLLMEELASRGYKQSLIAKANSALVANAKLIEGLEVTESSLNGFDCRTYFKDSPLLHFHESRAFTAALLFGVNKTNKYLITRRVQRLPKKIFVNNTVYKNADAIITVSNNIGNSLKFLFNEENYYKKIPDASSSFSFNENTVKKIRSKAKDKFIIGHIGASDDSHKGQLQIFSLANKLKKKYPDIIFMLVGSGRDLERFKHISRNSSNIIIEGQVENVGDYLKAFDLFIFPSRHEGLGSILLDALEYGLPVLASNVGGIPEIIKDGVNGYLVEIDAIDDYFKAVIQLYSDKRLYSEIQRNNIDLSNNYSVSTMTDAYIEIYERIVQLK